MWHLIWIVVKCLFWVVLLGAFYFALIRVAIIGRGFFHPDMQRVDAYFGLYKSWNSWKGYAAYYLLFALLVICPVVVAAIFWLV